MVSGQVSTQMASVMKVKRRYPLRERLEELGWSGTELAKRLSVHTNTTTWWFSHSDRIPGYVAAYVDQSIAIKQLGATVDPKGRRRRRKSK